MFVEESERVSVPDSDLDEDLDWDSEQLADTSTPLYEHYRFVADPGQTPVRADKFLFDRIGRISRNRIQLAAEAGCVFAGDNPIRSSYKVKPGDVLTIRMERPRNELEILPEDISLDIVYEDDSLLVVNKAAGMVVHPGHGNFTGTLLNALAYYLRHDNNFDPTDPRLGLVHRIDKDTSGLLVIAKNPDTKTHLSRQFFNKTTQRTYRALAWGRFEEKEGTIEGNIGRDLRNRTVMAVYPPNSEEGKPAVTHYSVLEEMAFVSWIECRLETGRTHQIRAHMSHIGHPLFSDEKYGGTCILRGNNTPKYRQFINNCFDICPRQALHAKTLGFEHPITGQWMSFDSELPTDLEKLLLRWQAYTQTLFDK
ncbi:ribosomal large subunit pseudouridine synthase D [Porphyromonas crevioricanis JCM 15906]|uniref:Pseudouridine synthase n=2 Tax=Porphyromonas crevioricanis TaxID=393921 RepID=A0A2X4PZX7_9PORP|nr:ribosomal large subunit pseudouridine synthase D [Porphyromonas crevioricanis JCM 15906]GAD08182.1 ribosomal large subunit pseudouridine synthase D [Porphyromonas crevioricanis JCM 13913]SJZ57072.1 23S rRNA pseudouridine1911/1915/1917 synthase [Porphyromonas crevioricanis]SQH73397.1 Ribosomal large subunit pseudouridine synthase D [Porphyromonas crevioricanis]